MILKFFSKNKNFPYCENYTLNPALEIKEPNKELPFEEWSSTSFPLFEDEELPLFEDYKELVKGEIADTRNTSKESYGPGTITAGLFLGNFVDKSPWAHFDIGAAGWAPSDKDYKKKGGTGVCLRTFIQLIEDWK